MSETQTPCIIIPGHWIGHFIGRGGCFATQIRKTYQVSYNIETTHNDQGHRIGEIYINGRNFAAAKAALCAEASRLNEIDERTNSGSVAYNRVACDSRRPLSPVSSDETPQRVPSGSTQSFPPLPKKVPTAASASASAVGIVQLREALVAEQAKVMHLVAKNSLLCALLHKEREMASSTLVIRGIPKVRMTGEPFGGDAIRVTLAKAGDITSLHLADAIGSGDKQVCYVTFKTRSTAVGLQKMLNGNKIEGSVVCVSFFVTRWDNTPSDAHSLSTQAMPVTCC
jgi:hypothetical protein